MLLFISWNNLDRKWTEPMSLNKKVIFIISTLERKLSTDFRKIHTCVEWGNASYISYRIKLRYLQSSQVYNWFI